MMPIGPDGNPDPFTKQRQRRPRQNVKSGHVRGEEDGWSPNLRHAARATRKWL